jgi:hypothetical protein
MDFFFGGTGKDYSWGLASESPIVIYDPQKNEFIALKSLEEAKKYEGTNCEIYIWSERTGNWETTQFVLLADHPSPVGFSIRTEARKPN